MNRRISKDLARAAAIRMGNAKYNEGIEWAKKRYTALVDQAIRADYPMPVLKVIEEFPDYFQTTKMVTLHCADDSSYLYGTASIYVSSDIRSIIVRKELFQTLREARSAWDKLENQRTGFIQNMAGILACELRYEKNVEKYLPEALPYIDFPVVNQPPALQEDHYANLRNFLKSIKKSV